MLYVGNPAGVSMPRRKAAIDAITQRAHEQYERTGNTEIMSKITQY